MKKFKTGEEFITDCGENFVIGKHFNEVYAELCDSAKNPQYPFDEDGLAAFLNDLVGGIWSDISKKIKVEMADVIVIDDYERDLWQFVEEIALAAWQDEGENKRGIYRGYVRIGNQVYVQTPDRDAKFGFTIHGDDQSWDSGFGLVGNGEAIIPIAASRVSAKDKELLGWILEEIVDEE